MLSAAVVIGALRVKSCQISSQNNFWVKLSPDEMVLMMGHKICFYGEIWLIIFELPLSPLLILSTVKDNLE